MTKEYIKDVIDKENGLGFSLNFNLSGYIFTKNESFIIFEFKILEEVKICHIKYIYFENEKDLTTIMVNCCNFWMGNNVRFIFYKEKEKFGNSAIKMLKNLNFRVDLIKEKYKWKFDFNCLKCNEKNCNCDIYNLYK